MDVDGIKIWMRAVVLRMEGLPELFSNACLNWHRRRQSHASVNGLSRATFQGQTAIVTGANAGIGLDLSLALARRGAHVIMACRSSERGEAAVRFVRSELNMRHSDDENASQQPDYNGAQSGVESEAAAHGSIQFQQLELASFHSVRAFAHDWERKHASAPDIIFCNAGIMAPLKRQQTPDGLELQFQVNYLSHWLLARSLTERRRQSSTRISSNKEANWDGCRVVLLSSCTHSGGRFDFSDLQARRHYNGLQSYANSKLALVMAAITLQQRFHAAGSNHSAVVVDPGILNTSLARGFFHQQVPSLLQPLLLPLVDLCLRGVLLPVEVATESLLWAASAPAEQVGGKFIKNAAVAVPSQKAYDEKTSQKLWQESCRLTRFSNGVHG